MIYCVEDDSAIRELVVYTLHSTGFEAAGYPAADSMFEALAQGGEPELILLDIMMPGDDGLAALKKLRASVSTRNIPVILITAKTAEYDRVIGLDLGADDYIPKPFGMMELVARIKAVLRRVSKNTDTGVLLRSGIVLDTKKHRVTAEGNDVELTLKEFKLLHLLMDNAGVVLTRDRLLSEVWGYDFDGETRTIDVHIRTLRQKIGDDSAELVETVRGVGYRFGDKKDGK